MYLHVGCGQLVDVKDIVTICDYETWSDSEDNRSMRSMLRIEQQVDYAREDSGSDEGAGEEIRSVVICNHKLIFSPITSRTLRLRLQRKNGRRKASET